MSDDNQKYAEQIRQIIPINELPAKIQNEVINKARIIRLRKGAYAFKQGDRDDYSFYLLEGEVELIANGQQHNVIAAGTDRARYAMAQLQPRQFSAKAKTKAVILQIVRDALDKHMVLQEKEQTDSNDLGADMEVAEMEFSEIDADVDWMTRMLQSELFSRMPTANIHGLFALLETVEFKAGDEVIKQGDPGEDYFIIQEGRCQVLRQPSSGGKNIKLAELKAGDSFGEEALISDMTRNATVSMLSDGILMQLSKDNFIELVKKPTLQSVTYDEALKLVEAGTAVWLDVRFKNEHEASTIEGSQNIPLNMLRMQASKLAQDKRYIAFCDTGGRSSTGAFLLAGQGLDVCFLKGGLVNNPQAAKSSEVTQVPEPKQQAAAPEPSVVEESVSKDQVSAVEEISRQDIDPDVKASVLETELARTNMQLRKTKKVKSRTDDKSVKEMHAEVERKLKEERAKIEIAKKEAEQEANRLRQQEEEKIRLMKENAEKRLQEEKKKLDAIYSRNVEEMEKLEQMKLEAKEQVKKEKQRLEQEADEAKMKLGEAEKIKKEMEAEKKALEEEALKRQMDLEAAKKALEEEAMKKQQELQVSKKALEEDAMKMQKELQEALLIKKGVEVSKKALEEEVLRKKQEQAAMEKEIQESAREKLGEERRKLAEEFAKSQEELEKAKQERAAAEAARKAAKTEAEKIISEYKVQHDKEREIEEEKLRAERLKLEEEQRKIQEGLREIQKAKEEAEAEKQKAIEETKRLQSKQADREVTQDKKAREAIKDEIKQVEDKIDKANKEIEEAHKAEQVAEVAQKINQEDLESKKAEEEELSRQLAADLKDFRDDLAEKDKNFANMTSQLEHMKRIQQSAAQAKKKAQESDRGLLQEIKKQLGD
ncbi:MAG: cyclic nucleotide-binding domain-containing protein [Gammaproteobacteria bacterium]|nr:cyclic nucleotide-binding domain-containing protein [Gammaproteobacteria bacterium]